ncbi:hypothetical protein [Rickettsiella endosymbiont of Miltochrista miniata]|uniref:hypothetical protein n=1 Tax=Rickettsiella endosymbiont of Miltochrista miniata TaxID=3066239 RepID=UPI00313BA17C
MPSIAPPIYDSEVNELSVFLDLKAAKDWLKNNKLDTSDTPILVPFKDDNDKVHFLKPSDPDTFSDPNNGKITEEANKNIRIIGAANSSHVHGFFGNISAAFTTKRVPHLNELEGDTINLADHGFIIIYKRGEEKAGHDFFKLFEKERERLIEEIKKAQTNEQPHVNPAEFLEALSKLAIDLKIKAGMCYFFGTDKNGKQHVYREIFRQDANSAKLDKYLKEESKWHESKPIKIKEHKSQNHHMIPFLIDWGKWTAFAAITAIGAGLILGIFITPPIGTIAAAVVAVATFVGMSSIGLAKADRDNPTTTDFDTPEFEVESEVSFLSRIKARISSLHDFFNSKSNKTVALSTQTNENEISSAPIGIFTTIVASTRILPTNKANFSPTINALVESSLCLFSFQKEKELIPDKGLNRSLSLRN